MRTLLVVLALALLASAPADAAVSRKKAIWGPLEVDGQSQFPTYAQLGVPGGNLHGPGHLERVSAPSAADVEAACKAWRLRDRDGV